MSEGEKAAMENKRTAAVRQLAASSPRDNGSALSKGPRQNASGRRDFAGSSRPPADLAGSARRPVQPRARFVDKRPRARGCYSSDQKEEVAKEEPPGPEHGSVQAWGSKKSNLNHLLNFHFESRDLPRGHGRVGGYGFGRYDTGRWSGRRGFKGTVPYNKERFLQANCQFVVREGKEYTVHAVDPDVLVEWELIEQVRIFGHEVPSCPICLYPPKAAKITRCGHIYCWPCMLHYLSLDDKSWRKCPICYESVHEKDLKSVTALETHHYSVGEQITMRLMKKPRGSLQVMPANESSPTESFPRNISDTANTRYTKLLAANVEHIQDIIAAERSELEHQLQEEGEGSLEGSYISSALASLKRRELSLTNDSEPVVEPAVVEPVEPPPVAQGSAPVPQADCRYVCAFDDEPDEIVSRTSERVGDEGFDVGCEVNLVGAAGTGTEGHVGLIEVASSPAILLQYGDEEAENTGLPEMLESVMVLHDDVVPSRGSDMPCGAVSKSSPALDNAFYFYQAADGQHIYMHSLNIRCMVKEYGSLRDCPDTVTAKVVELESVSMDEELRRRLRYLSHLPLTCEFVMAELDLKPPLLSPQVLADFADDLTKRRLNRQKRARSEKKLATRIQRAENKQMGIDPTMHIVRSEFTREPVYTATAVDEAVPSSTEIQDVALSVSCEDVDPLPDVGASRGPRTESGSSQDSSSTSPTVLSFAQMLKAGSKSKPSLEAWPRTSKPDVVAKSTGGERPTWGSGADSDADEYAPVPSYQTSMSDAIQAALDSYTKDPGVAGKEDGTSVSPTGGGSAGKKKKNKKKLLFSTTLPRGN